MKTAEQKLEQELGDLYRQVPPPPRGLVPGRERLVAEATLLRRERPVSTTGAIPTKTVQRRPNMKLVLMYKLIAAVLAMVMGTTAVSGGVALAANATLPGDALYQVKLGIEDMRIALATDPAAEAELNLASAQRRAQEMERLISQDRLMPEEGLARMTQSTEQAMVRTAYAPPAQTAGLLAQIVTATEAQERVLQQAMAAAPKGAQAALQHALQATQEIRLRAQEGVQDPEGFRRQYQKRAEEQLGPSATPSPSGTQERNREQGQNRDRSASPTVTPLQNRNGTATPAGAPQQTREQDQNRDQTMTCTPQQTREQDQNRDRTPTCTPQQTGEQERNRNQTPQATHTPEPTATRQAAQTPTPQGTREQNQNRVQTATVTPQQNQNQTPQPTHTHVPTATPQGMQGSGSTCTPAPQSTPQQEGNRGGKP